MQVLRQDRQNQLIEVGLHSPDKFEDDHGNGNNKPGASLFHGLTLTA